VLRGLLDTTLAFGVAGPLAVTVGFDGFLLKVGDRGTTLASDLKVGLQVGLGGHIQQF
jgi:hypothetical protein